MSGEFLHPADQSPLEETLWRPSVPLRGHLLRGALGALASGAITVAATVVEWAEGEQPGFTLVDALDLAVILPDIFLLLAAVKLGGELGKSSLQKSAWGFFGSLWLLNLLALADPELVPKEVAMSVALLVGLGIVALLIVPFYPFGKPDSESEKTGSIGCGAVFVCVFVFSRAIKWMGRKLDLETAVTFESFAVLAMLLTFSGWLGVVLIRLRSRLGSLAAFLGWFHILGVVVALVLFGLMIGAIVAVADRPDADPEKEFDNWMANWKPSFMLGMIVGTVVQAALTAGLFLSLRARSGDDWLTSSPETSFDNR